MSGEVDAYRTKPALPPPRSVKDLLPGTQFQTRIRAWGNTSLHGRKVTSSGLLGYKGGLCDNAEKAQESMLLDELQREFDLVRSRALVIRGYL